MAFLTLGASPGLQESFQGIIDAFIHVWISSLEVCIAL